MLGYTYQLYFDFAGYSNMAIGLGYMFGVHIPINFNSPYKATDPSDFWRRWHISLSTCLRDYLYIPLGGTRGSRWFIYKNILITMLLGGLWHGANWTFVIWGGYHGLLLVIYHATKSYWDQVNKHVRQLVMFILIIIGWVLFRSDNISMALSLLERMFVWTAGPLITGWPMLSALLIVAALLAHIAPNSSEISHKWNRYAVLAMTLTFGLCIFVIYGAHQQPFLYFQF
jgi:alginate O-acetyltransferase complex protein AlgI